MKFFKVKDESLYYKDLMQAINDEKKLLKVTEEVRKEYNLSNCEFYSTTPDYYYHQYEELTDDAKKWFKKDGIAKKNSVVHKYYLQKLEEFKLKDMKTVRDIDFIYGIMKRSVLETLATLKIKDAMYLKTDTHFGESELEHLTEITEVEYTEIYLEALKEKK